MDVEWTEDTTMAAIFLGIIILTPICCMSYYACRTCGGPREDEPPTLPRIEEEPLIEEAESL
jgi:hypothetical protein